MIVELLTTLSRALELSPGLALVAAFAWGLVSILLSPCHLSSIPLIIGFLNTQGTIRVRQSFKLSLVFTLGILVSIALIGAVTGLLGRILGDVGTVGNYLVALIFVILGFYLLDIIHLPWSGIRLKSTPEKGMLAALLLGLLIGTGLGPCTFAFLAPLLVVVFKIATVNIGRAALLLVTFGIGHAAVIIAAGTFATKVQTYLNWTESSAISKYLKRLCGILVILAGFYMFFGELRV
ncbi:cytochrome c biogenesis CcdA family protein [Candidatus Neomarinimicrobiota bacterium]